MLGYSMPKPYAMLALSLTGLLYPWSGAGVTRSFALSCVHLFSRFREPPSSIWEHSESIRERRRQDVLFCTKRLGAFESI